MTRLPLFVLPSSPTFQIKSHSRNASQTALPLIAEAEEPMDIEMEDILPETVYSPTSEDEEVPKPTLDQLTTRRSNARSHVMARLQALQFEEWNTLAMGISSCNINAHYCHEIEKIGLINPEMWMQIPSQDGEHWILDRKYLGEINAAAFKKTGVLRQKFHQIERPDNVPALYWDWLRGKSIVAKEWADGWVGDTPTLVWIARWRDGELSKKEWTGKKNVSFKIADEVKTFGGESSDSDDQIM
ncbi:hypothetical protein EJ08DRAFT_650286 [Tothia fuscella]|uniref:Uncharacterized protein n=1 Tax=Tothia fuscella TaxID=1048955 RepID=A0A9P4NQ31_9PEZI|nr:hypothetical protein EJ08DRAFT_650286 [Tothia fuscella]